MNIEYPLYILYNRNRPKHTLTDIFYRKQYISTHKNYIHFIDNLLLTTFDRNESLNRKYILNGINKIIRILALNVQNNIINRTLVQESHSPDEHPFFTCLPDFCPFCEIRIDEVTTTRFPTPFPFDLSLHPTLSYPWHQKRLMNSFGKIGAVLDNPFSFKEMNHFDNILISPINLFITGNGYHSSCSGIYDSKAVSYAQYTMDISSLYDIVYFDGIVFRHSLCNCILNSPIDKSVGTIYEIGRLLMKNKLNLLCLHPQWELAFPPDSD